MVVGEGRLINKIFVSVHVSFHSGKAGTNKFSVFIYIGHRNWMKSNSLECLSLVADHNFITAQDGVSHFR